MSVVLFRDPGDGEHVAEMPAWIAPSVGDRYWHQPRSASTHRGKLLVRYWCGQTASVEEWRLKDRPPADMRCGTCVGRRAGFDRSEGTVFRPRDHWSLPGRCPGVSWDAPDFKLCHACGERVQASRGWNSWGSARHRPGPGLAERLKPCPNHGWRDIRGGNDGRFHCTSWRCEWSA